MNPAELKMRLEDRWEDLERQANVNMDVVRYRRALEKAIRDTDDERFVEALMARHRQFVLEDSEYIDWLVGRRHELGESAKWLRENVADLLARLGDFETASDVFAVQLLIAVYGSKVQEVEDEIVDLGAELEDAKRQWIEAGKRLPPSTDEPLPDDGDVEFDGSDLGPAFQQSDDEDFVDEEPADNVPPNPDANNGNQDGQRRTAKFARS